MAEPTEAANSAKATLQEIVALMGWELDPAKSGGMATCIDLLGCRASVVPDGLHWALTSERTEEWCSSIQCALQEGMLTTGAASKLAGRLLFASSRVFGKAGRAAIRPILWRQQGRGAETLSRRLRSSLLWWLSLLRGAPARRLHHTIAHAATPDVLLYTDAEGAGGVGVTVYWCHQNRWEYAAGLVPRRWRRPLRRRETQINAFELLAMLTAWETWGEALCHQRVVCFVDNTAALNILLKGWSPLIDLNWVAGRIWLRTAVTQASVVWQWVPSLSNPADAPSLGQVSVWSHCRRRALKWPSPPQQWGFANIIP